MYQHLNHLPQKGEASPPRARGVKGACPDFTEDLVGMVTHLLESLKTSKKVICTHYIFLSLHLFSLGHLTFSYSLWIKLYFSLFRFQYKQYLSYVSQRPFMCPWGQSYSQHWAKPLLLAATRGQDLVHSGRGHQKRSRRGTSRSAKMNGCVMVSDIEPP